MLLTLQLNSCLERTCLFRSYMNIKQIWKPICGWGIYLKEPGPSPSSLRAMLQVAHIQTNRTLFERRFTSPSISAQRSAPKDTAAPIKQPRIHGVANANKEVLENNITAIETRLRSTCVKLLQAVSIYEKPCRSRFQTLVHVANV